MWYLIKSVETKHMLLGYAQINSKHSLMGFSKDQTSEAEGKVCDIHF